MFRQEHFSTSLLCRFVKVFRQESLLYTVIFCSAKVFRQESLFSIHLYGGFYSIGALQMFRQEHFLYLAFSEVVRQGLFLLYIKVFRQERPGTCFTFILTYFFIVLYPIFNRVILYFLYPYFVFLSIYLAIFAMGRGGGGLLNQTTKY